MTQKEINDLLERPQPTCASMLEPIPMYESPHLVKIAAALEHAKRKHPFFADKLFSFKRLVDCQEYLAAWRRQLEIEARENRTSAKTALTCEGLEAEEAFLLGNYHATMEELAQCGAVVVRMMEAVQALVDEAENAGKEEG